MRISDVLRDKAHKLVSVLPGTSLHAAAVAMKNERVGALLVRDPDGTPEDGDGRLIGIVSERDIVLALAERGRDVFSLTVRQVMRSALPTAAASDRVADVMKAMTEQRVRHLPVMAAGEVVGLVSIGDIIKSRLTEKTEENAVLQDIARVRRAAA